MKLKSLLMELPYIPTGFDEPPLFDLELEKLNGKSINSLIDLFDDIFVGREYKDKYGTTFSLKNKRQKEQMKRNIVDDYIAVKMIGKLFGLSKNNLKTMLRKY